MNAHHALYACVPLTPQQSPPLVFSPPQWPCIQACLRIFFRALIPLFSRTAGRRLKMEPMSPAKDREESIKLLIAAQAHLGTKNMDLAMSDYVWRRRA